ncbi:hypothetical protein ACFX1R_048550 [Malus domestica]
MGVRSFRSVKKSIQRLEEAAVSCGAPERLEMLRSWVLLLKEVDRLKLSQGFGDVSYNSCDGQPRVQTLTATFSGEFIESWRAQFWPNSIKLGNNWPLAPNPLPCVTQRQGGGVLFCTFSLCCYAKTTLTMIKMEDAKPEVSASNNSNSKSSDSGLLQD